MKYLAPITDYVKASTGDYVKASTGDYIKQSIYEKTVFYQASEVSDIPNVIGYIINTLYDQVQIFFHIPNELLTLQSIKLIVNAWVTKPHIVTLDWRYGAVGEAHNIHSGTASNYGMGTLTAGTKYAITLPTAFTSSLSQNDIGGLHVMYADASDDINCYVLGLLLKYTVRETG